MLLGWMEVEKDDTGVYSINYYRSQSGRLTPVKIQIDAEHKDLMELIYKEKNGGGLEGNVEVKKFERLINQYITTLENTPINNMKDQKMISAKLETFRKIREKILSDYRTTYKYQEKLQNDYQEFNKAIFSHDRRTAHELLTRHNIEPREAHMIIREMKFEFNQKHQKIYNNIFQNEIPKEIARLKENNEKVTPSIIRKIASEKFLEAATYPGKDGKMIHAAGTVRKDKILKNFFGLGSKEDSEIAYDEYKSEKRKEKKQTKQQTKLATPPTTNPKPITHQKNREWQKVRVTGTLVREPSLKMGSYEGGERKRKPK